MTRYYPLISGVCLAMNVTVLVFIQTAITATTTIVSAACLVVVLIPLGEAK